MRDSILKSSARISRIGFDFGAGDLITCVPPVRPMTITDASSTTPIVISAVNDLIENALLLIVNVGGNGAANGTRLARSVTAESFALYDPETGDPIASSGDYTEGGMASRSPVTIRAEKWDNPRARAEGLGIDLAGLKDGEESLLRFLNENLITAGIPGIDAEWHFTINGERWDFVKHQPVRTDSEIGGGAITTTCVIRKAVELNETVAPTTGFSWN